MPINFFQKMFNSEVKALLPLWIIITKYMDSSMIINY